VEAQRLLAGPDRSSPEGARDYALMLILLRTGIRVSEACGLRRSDIGWNQGRWLLTFKTRGGDERNIPLPKEIKEAVDAYLKLDRDRRRNLRSDSLQSFIFQPSVNYRTLEFDKPLSPTQAWKVVRRWGEYTGVGKVSPHDLRSTAITRSLDLGLSPHQVRMMTGHKSLEMITRYARPLEGQEWNAVHFLDYAEDSLASRAGETSGAPAEKK
jgi:integrase/recombinase XerD